MKLSEKYKDLFLSSDEWKEVEELVDILRHPYHVTMLLQRDDFTMADFYAAWSWIELKLRMQHSNHLLAKCIAKSMDSKKHEHLVQNPLMYCSVYMDPRFKAEMAGDLQKKYLARMFLSKLWERINDRNRQDESDENMRANTSTAFDYSFVTKYLSNLNCATGPSSTRSTRIEELLNAYENEKSEDMNVSVLDFWEKKKEDSPELYKLAMIVHAVPATQASVERTFSTLTFVFSKLRGRLSAKLLENIMLIKLNKDLFDAVLSDELNTFLNIIN